MGAAALPTLFYGLQDKQRCFNAVAQADRLVPHLCFFVEPRDFEVQLPQDFVGAIEPLCASDQPNVIPHRLADAEPVLRDSAGSTSSWSYCHSAIFGK